MFDRHTEGATSYFPPEKVRGESETEMRKLKETGSDSENGKEETLLKQGKNPVYVIFLPFYLSILNSLYKHVSSL